MATESSHKQDSKPAPKPQSADERFRYIGFGVFPKKTKKFWKTADEESRFIEGAKKNVGLGIADRDFSNLHEEVMGTADRVVLTATGLVMIASMAMPWIGYRTMQGTDFALSWGAALGMLFGNFGTAFAGGWAVGLSAICALILMIGGPLVGVWTLAMVWMKAGTPEAYQLRLRKPLKISYILFYAFMAIMVLGFVGGRIPGFETWGLIDPGEKYNFATLLSILSYGPFILVAMAMINGVKSGDL